MESDYRNFITQFPDNFILFLKIEDEQKEAELHLSNKFQIDSVRNEIVIFRKVDLQIVFEYFKNVPSKVVWADTAFRTKGAGPYQVELIGYFIINPPTNFITRLFKPEYRIQFSMIAKLDSIDYFL
ncbi:MAG TPA: hypothetical protein VK158_01530 [Acidobacteriota bacterium]|nr:hypothetical protein [Acidobacteriota bacterium]